MPVFTSSIELSDDYPSFEPSLKLNFAQSRSLDPRITFTRASVATYFDRSGNIQTAGKNEPRFDHNPATRESLGLLLEEESTNLVNSNANAADWNVGSASQETTYPIKGLYTTRLMDLGGDGDSPYLGGGSYGTGSSIVVTMSMYIDAVNSTSNTVTMFMFGGGYINHQWNISTGVPVPNNSFSINGSDYNSGSAQTIDCGGGIYRLVLTATYTGGSTTTRFYVTPSGADSDYVIIAGMQTEVRPFPTSVIITSGTPVTRNYDDAQILEANFTDNFNQFEGTFVGECDRGNDGTEGAGIGAMRRSADSYFDMIQFGEFYDNGGMVGRVYIGGGSQANIGATHTTGQGVYNRYAFAYKKDSFNGVINGVGQGEDTSGNIPTELDRFLFGSYSDDRSTTNLDGHIKYLHYYPQRLTNAQLQLLTA